VVEDNPVNQRVARLILERLGCRVDLAANGVEALRMVETFRYELILMDVQMPEMDGFEATRAIRALPGPAGAVPIVAMTASVMQEDRDRVLECGMTGFMPKPVRLDSVRRLLESVLGGRIGSDPLSPGGEAPWS
jgi:CheY-like chemotaxis protein